MKKQTKKKGKALALSFVVAAGMLLPIGASAQGGLFDHNGGNENGPHQSLMDRGTGGDLNVTKGNESFGAAGSDIENEPFGAPIGGGIGILIAAGAGYALIQSKKNKQN